MEQANSGKEVYVALLSDWTAKDGEFTNATWNGAGFDNVLFILQATFSAVCIVDYKKNEHTSEIAYNGKTIDIVHISTLT